MGKCQFLIPTLQYFVITATCVKDYKMSTYTVSTLFNFLGPVVQS